MCWRATFPIAVVCNIDFGPRAESREKYMSNLTSVEIRGRRPRRAACRNNDGLACLQLRVPTAQDNYGGPAISEMSPENSPANITQADIAFAGAAGASTGRAAY
jgi:hypothetical protein